MNRLRAILLASTIAAAWLGAAVPAFANGCGDSNPNCTVPTAPFGTSNSQAASTQFVQQALSGGTSTVVHGPGASTVGHVAVWNSTGGTLLADSDEIQISGSLVTFPGAVNISGNPSFSVSMGVNPNFGLASLTSQIILADTASLTAPETGLQLIMNSSIGSTLGTNYKMPLFASNSCSAAAPCYVGNLVLTLNSGYSSSGDGGIVLEPDLNILNGVNYGDSPGPPTEPYAANIYLAGGPGGSRATAMALFDESGPINRGMAFWSGNGQTVRLNVIEDYSDVTGGGFLYAAGTYAAAAIDLSAATISGNSINFPNNIPLAWRNAGNTAFIAPIVVDGSNDLDLGTGASLINAEVPIEALAGLSSSGQVISIAARTVASAAAATLDDLVVAPETTTITGTTGVTTAKGFNKVSIYQPTITDASGVTITNAATLYIDNAPAAGGSVTITNAYAVWVGAGKSLFGGTVSSTGGFIADGATGLNQTCTVNQAKTLIFTLGILTGGTCNT